MNYLLRIQIENRKYFFSFGRGWGGALGEGSGVAAGVGDFFTMNPN